MERHYTKSGSSFLCAFFVVGLRGGGRGGFVWVKGSSYYLPVISWRSREAFNVICVGGIALWKVFLLVWNTLLLGGCVYIGLSDVLTGLGFGLKLTLNALVGLFYVLNSLRKRVWFWFGFFIFISIYFC